MREGTYQLLPVMRITSSRRFQENDAVVREVAAQVHLDGKVIAHLCCLPSGLSHLAVGYLFAHQLICSYEQILSVRVQQRGNRSHRIDITTANAHAAQRTDGKVLQQAKITSAAHAFAQTCGETFGVSSACILRCMKEFERASFLFRYTGGTHSCGLYDKDGGLCHVLFEDTGRLNAVDKVIGHCLAHHINAKNRMLFVSGRVSAELVKRAIGLHVPVLVSPSAPTDRAIELGEEEGITIVGFVREERMNVYTHTGRVL